MDALETVTVAFVVGLFVGANLGLIIASVLAAAKNRNRWVEEE